MIKSALISVSDKRGAEELAFELAKLKIRIISTGGTAKVLRNSIPDLDLVEELTGFPEILDGRVKTLHPKIYGGILALRNNPQHQKTLEKHHLLPIDLVVVNLYPFEAKAGEKNANQEEIIENIDIGGPALIRAAAKNFQFVAVVVDPDDYPLIIKEIKTSKELSLRTRRHLAEKAFAYTAYYDSVIASYFRKETFPQKITLGLNKRMDLRYGENPNQKASLYKEPLSKDQSLLDSAILQGKQLSYNNILDAEAAFNLIKEFKDPAAAVIKHTNPCGTAESNTILTALKNAYNADSLSAFGGIVILNRQCSYSIAEYLNKFFVEIIMAPDFNKNALKLFSKKPNLRLIRLGKISPDQSALCFKKISGGVLIQETNNYSLQKKDFRIVTRSKPAKTQLADLEFAWKVCKYVKSNSIVLAKNKTTVGVGAGQMSRVDSVRIALWKAKKKAQEAVVASDGFFPFRDTIDLLAKVKISAIIQPGGSVRDKEVIEAANEYNIPMIFTGYRTFLH